MYKDSISVHVREKLGIVLLAGVLLAAWGCGNNGDEPSTIPRGSFTQAAPSARTATPSPEEPVNVNELPTSGPTRPTPTMGTPATRVPTRTPAPTRAPWAMIRIGAATGLPGETVLVDIRLTSVERFFYEIAATLNDIGFDSLARIAARETGGPDCVVNPEINKAATVFAFQPGRCIETDCTRGCDGDDCTSMKAIVLTFDNLDPIPEGSLLYTCNVAISAAAVPGSVFPLTCLFAEAADPDGNPVGLGCDEGQILVDSE